ncbi:hypothetical protein DSO57_1037619, partial [Entomophthora muscae]
MVLFEKFLAFLSPIVHVLEQLIGKGNGVPVTDNDCYLVGGKTADSFPTSTSMCLAEDVGWANSPTRFTTFHLQSEWYGKETVLKMKREMASQIDMEFLSFDPEFYHFDGGTPISKALTCPYLTICLMIASWRDATWNVERVMLTKQGNRIPLRIAQLINNITKAGTSHYMVIQGPK